MASHRGEVFGVRRPTLRMCLIALMPLATACGGSDDASASTAPTSHTVPITSEATLVLAGELNTLGQLTLSQLQAQPAATQTVSFSSGSGPQTHTYSGAGLWTLLSQAGIRANSAVHNDVLGKYVVATGSDGYRTVVSLAEISPDFGNQPDIVAYAMNGAPLTTSGFARLVIPNDDKAGRYVSNLISLEVVSAAR